MSEYIQQMLTLAPALATGVLLGMFFFVGLWWTVRKLAATRHVALLFLGSLLVRTSIVMLGFYFILGDNWQRLLTGLLGFVIARIIVTRFIHMKDKSTALLNRAGHES